MPQAALAKPLTKSSWTANSADHVLRALYAAHQGPVSLSVPQDVLEATLEWSAKPLELPEGTPGPVPEELHRASRPLIVAGPGALHGAGRRRLARFEEDSGIPVIAMESPRGVNDPSLGKLSEVLAKADVALLMRKPLDFTLQFGKAFAPGCKILRFDGELSFPTAKKSGWLQEVRAALAYRPAEWAGIAGSLHPVAVCREVQKLLNGKDSIFVSDGGEFGQWAQACLSAPRRIVNGPAGSIGSALPFAAAAKRAFPEARVVALLGDGTFGFHLSEIDTAVRYGLDYIAVVGNDACWNAEYQIAVKSYGAERAKNLDLLPTRYGAVAAALGAHGEDVTRFEDLAPALDRAAKSGKPAVVNVLIERHPAPKYS
jgi:acetolactate synthase-1/2/3 large subunit